MKNKSFERLVWNKLYLIDGFFMSAVLDGAQKHPK